MTPQLKKKVAQAIKLLQSIPTDKGDIELSYSGGKDSDVCLELCKMAGLKLRPIYKCTTIDPKGTTAHCKSKGVEVVMPDRTFHLPQYTAQQEELTDILICCLTELQRSGVNIRQIIEDKIAYNEQRND